MSSCAVTWRRVGYISQGSIQDRTARKGGGAGDQWTRKVVQKTVTGGIDRRAVPCNSKKPSPIIGKCARQLKENGNPLP